MNNLEKEMEEAVNAHVSDHEITLACASVAMKWIEKAYEAGADHGYDERNPDKLQWLKENGLTPTKPERCSTCGEPQNSNEPRSQVCSNSFHLPTEPDTKEQ